MTKQDYLRCNFCLCFRIPSMIHLTKSLFSKISPLSGTKVLDLSRVLAGPLTSMLLSEYGAEVIKIEQPGYGDETRHWGPPYYEDEKSGKKMSTYFISLNKNKQSICVDLKKSDGQNLIKKLAENCDVLIENFLPGTMSKYGLDYESIKKVNEKIVYASLTGYGQTGPYVNRGGYDVIASSIGGMFSITGTPEQPIRPGVAITDICTALYCHGAIMAAMMEGKGRWIQSDLLATQLSVNTYAASAFLNSGVVGKRYGTAHPSIVPYQSFRCKDGEWLTVGGANDKLYFELLDAIKKVVSKEFDLEFMYEFKGNPNRVKHRIEIISTLEKVFLSENLDFWVESFRNCRFPHGAVNTMDRVFEDPQVIHKNVVEEIHNSGIKVVKHPINLGSELSSDYNTVNFGYFADEKHVFRGLLFRGFIGRKTL